MVNFPIHDAHMTWSVAAALPNARAPWAPWEQAHSWRAPASVVAFALQVSALGVRAR
jgi:hypothetical protein